MTENEAIEELKNSIISYYVQNPSNITCDLTTEVLDMAINALEKLEKIKEAFEMWKAETGGYYGADDETTKFIRTLNQILRSE